MRFFIYKMSKEGKNAVIKKTWGLGYNAERINACCPGRKDLRRNEE